MFIRKKKNKNGTYTVLLLTGERVHGRKYPVSKMLKCFGTANDDEQLKKLIEEAEQYKNHIKHITPKHNTLRINADVDINSCITRNVGFHDIYGQYFSNVFKSFKLKNNVLQKLQDIVVMRIANPCSKRKTALISSEYGFNLHVDSIYKLMDLITPTLISDCKKIIYKHTQKLLAQEKLTIDVLFYDLTTIYFETNEQNDLRNFGFSKDGKHQHVQIMLAVIVTKDGLPIDYEEFPGNTYEGHTLLPVLEKIKTRYKIDKIVIVADAALMNKVNLSELDSQGMQYIIAAKIKVAKKEVKKTILDFSGYQTISASSDSENGITDKIQSKIVPTEVGDFIFAYHSTKRARKDAYDREKNLEKIKKYLNSTGKNKLASILKKSYLKIKKDSAIEIDLDKLKETTKFDGFFGLRTNIVNANPMEILKSYRGLWQVEQTFRIAKSNLEIRPVFHYTPRRIRAHFLICYMALALVRYVEFILKIVSINITTEHMLMLLNQVRKVRIVDDKNNLFDLLEDFPKELIPVYHALKIKTHKKFQFIPNM